MSDIKRVLDKIQKCLNLSKSTNPHEAAQALKQAYALMRKHDIDSGIALEISNFTTGDEISCCRTRQIPRYLSILVSSIARCFSVEATTQASAETTFTRNQFRNKFNRTIRFYGHKSDVLIAEYAFSYLSRLLTKARKEHITQNKLSLIAKSKAGDLFAEGWVAGVHKEMYKIRRISDDDEHNKQSGNIHKYIEACKGKLDYIETKEQSAVDSESMFSVLSGYNTGRKVSVNIAVNGSDDAVMLN